MYYKEKLNYLSDYIGFNWWKKSVNKNGFLLYNKWHKAPYTPFNTYSFEEYLIIREDFNKTGKEYSIQNMRDYINQNGNKYLKLSYKY